MTVQFPTAIFTPRVTENLPGITYDPTQKQNMFSEDFQNLGAEINAIETELGENLENVIALVREKLTTNRTYYVRIDGNDSNTGLVNSAVGAFLTIQKAVNSIGLLDIAGFNVVIQLADGTYNEGVNLINVIGYATLGNLVIRGNTGNISSVIINTISNSCFTAAGLFSVWHIEYLKMQTTTDGNCLNIDGGTTLRFGFVNFGACASRHINVSGFSIVTCYGNYTISGGAILHIQATCSNVNIISITITLSGTPAFSYMYIGSTYGSVIMHHACTFTGSATGGRYDCSCNSVLYVSSGGATYFPGNAAGIVATGGQYI